MKNNIDLKKFQNIVSKIENVFKCNEKHCSEQKAKLSVILGKLSTKRLKIVSDMQTKKISQKDFYKQMASMNKVIDKTQEKINFTDCQLKHCYKTTKIMLMNTINLLLKKNDKKKQPNQYKLIMKYKTLFSNKITTKDIHQFDRDTYRMIF